MHQKLLCLLRYLTCILIREVPMVCWFKIVVTLPTLSLSFFNLFFTDEAQSEDELSN